MHDKLGRLAIGIWSDWTLGGFLKYLCDTLDVKKYSYVYATDSCRFAQCYSKRENLYVCSKFLQKILDRIQARVHDAKQFIQTNSTVAALCFIITFIITHTAGPLVFRLPVTIRRKREAQAQAIAGLPIHGLLRHYQSLVVCWGADWKSQ